MDEYEVEKVKLPFALFFKQTVCLHAASKHNMELAIWNHSIEIFN